MRKKPNSHPHAWSKDRVKGFRDSGKSLGGLAKALGWAQPRLSELMKGKGKKILPQDLRIMAAYLEMDEDELGSRLVGEAYVPGAKKLTSVMIRGAVEAGVFKQGMEWPRPDWVAGPATGFSRYDQYPQFGLIIRDPSMNRHYPEGSVVICVKFSDLVRDACPGERVIVLRSAETDDGVEVAAKQVRVDSREGLWLWPESHHPDFQQPWPLPSLDMAMRGDGHLHIVALIIGAYRLEPYA